MDLVLLVCVLLFYLFDVSSEVFDLVFVVGVLGLEGIKDFRVYLGFLELVYASVEGCQLFLVVSFLHS